MIPRASFCGVPLVLLILGTFGNPVRTMPLEPLEQLGTPGTVAPARFVVRLETTKGTILIECFRDWVNRTGFLGGRVN